MVLSSISKYYVCQCRLMSELGNPIVPSDQPHRDACKQSFTRPPPPPPRPAPGPGVSNCATEPAWCLARGWSLIATLQILVQPRKVVLIICFCIEEEKNIKTWHKESISKGFIFMFISFWWNAVRTEPRNKKQFMVCFMDTPWTELWRDVNTSRPTELHPAPPPPPRSALLQLNSAAIRELRSS